MPKLTVFTEKETGKQEGIDNSSQSSLLSIQKDDLLEISLFGAEKNDQNKPDEVHFESLAQKFNGYLIQAIDEALTSLGESVKNTIYFQLENNFNIPRKEIPDQIEEFTNIMHKIFGLSASRLEIRFTKNLNSKLCGNVESSASELPLSEWIVKNMSFTDLVQRMREEYCSGNKSFEQLQNTQIPGN